MLRCEICAVSVSGERNYQMHLKGKKHRLRLLHMPGSGDESPLFIPLPKSAYKHKYRNFEVPEIAPGEPIPPGLEDVVENFSQVEDDANVRETPAVGESLSPSVDEPDLDTVMDTACQMQSELDSHKSALIGLDFLVEAIVKGEPEKVEYFCLLCDKKGPKRIVISHVMTLNHQAKYLRVLFPAVTQYINKKFIGQDSKKVISRTINEVCTKIEMKLGRPKPLVVEKDLLITNKSEYYEKITKQHNFRTEGIKLSEIIDLENEIDEETVFRKTEEDNENEEIKQRSEYKKKEAEKKIVKTDEDSDDIQVISVINKVKVSVDKSITREEGKNNKEVKESLRGGIDPDTHNLASVSERSEVTHSGEGNPAVAKKGDCHRRSLSKLSSISSASSPDNSFVRISSGSSSPSSVIDKRSHRTYSPARMRKPFSFNSAKKSFYRNRNMERISRRRRSRSRSVSENRSRSRSSSGSRALHSRVVLGHKSRLKSRSPSYRVSLSPERSHRRHPSPSTSPVKHKTKQRNKGLPFKSNAERSDSHGEDRSGKHNTRQKHQSQYSIWEKFRMEADELEIEMAATRRRYERSPEKHPRYAMEWKTFYSTRMEEAKGKKTVDPRSEEFKLEWILFWGEKMNELLNQEFRNRKDDIRKRLGLPEELKPTVRFEVKRKHEKKCSNSEGEDDWIPPPPRKISESSTPGISQPNVIVRQEKPVTISDVKSTWRALTGGNIDSGAKQQKESDEFEVNWGHSATGLIPTLRIVSALEVYLGSLGPRVNSHLSNALSIQRGGCSLTSLAYTSDIIILFETVKEKLIGQLQAGIVKKSMVSAVNRAINAISNLLEKVNLNQIPIKGDEIGRFSFCRTYSFGSVLNIKPELREAIESVTRHLVPESTQSTFRTGKLEEEDGGPLSVPGIGNLNKIAVAQQIALALIERGKSDVSEGELQNLVDEVIGLAHVKSSENNESKEACEVLPVGIDSNLVEKQVSRCHSPFNELITEVCDQAVSNQISQSQPSDDHNKMKYNLIEVDLEKEPCKRNYRHLSMQTLLSAIAQRGRIEELHASDLKRLIQRFHFFSNDEQQCVINYIEGHKSEFPEEAEMLYRLLDRKKLMEEEQKEKYVLLHKIKDSSACMEMHSSQAMEGEKKQEVNSELFLAASTSSSSSHKNIFNNDVEMRRLVDEKEDSFRSVKRHSVNFTFDENVDRSLSAGSAMRCSLIEQSMDQRLNEAHLSHGTAHDAMRTLKNYDYSRMGDVGYQYANRHGFDYIPLQNQSHDEREYVNTKNRNYNRICEMNYQDSYYPEEADGYKIQRRNNSFRVQQHHSSRNDDSVSDYYDNSSSFYQQQQSMITNSQSVESRDPRNYINYHSEGYFRY